MCASFTDLLNAGTAGSTDGNIRQREEQHQRSVPSARDRVLLTCSSLPLQASSARFSYQKKATECAIRPEMSLHGFLPGHELSACWLVRKHRTNSAPGSPKGLSTRGSVCRARELRCFALNKTARTMCIRSGTRPLIGCGWRWVLWRAC